ncbi:MAG: DMT family transporter [Gammaproteobacteria bacterium]
MNQPTPTTSVLSGIILIIVSGFMLSGMDSIAKYLMLQQVTITQVVWARYFISTIIISLFYTAIKQPIFIIPEMPGLQLVRGLCLLGVTGSMYYAIRTVSLADTTAIMFFAPVLVTLLAGIVLDEQVTIQHISAVILGFIGVLFIVRPGFEGFEPILLLVFVTAFCLAFYLLLTRYVRRGDGEPVTMFHSVFAGAVIMAFVAPFSWTPLTAAQWGAMIMMGLFGVLGHLAIVKAFHITTATILSPFLNSQLLAAAIYSVIFFNDRLEWTFYVGSALIVSAGLIAWMYQKILK